MQYRCKTSFRNFRDLGFSCLYSLHRDLHSKSAYYSSIYLSFRSSFCPGLPDLHHSFDPFDLSI
jgi:hypothetical protein